MAQLFYGIDLGTTHTVVVKATKEGREWKYQRLPLPNMPVNPLQDIKETELLPSAVYFPKNGDDPVVGLYAKECIHSQPERVYINSKIDLGGSITKRTVASEHSPIEVSKEILKVCFRAIYEDGGENVKIRISVPAAFSLDKRSDTKQAAELAKNELGFSNLNFINTTEEPYAALVNLTVNEPKFTEMIKNDNSTIMLIDIGGGTMDIIICDLIKEKTANTIDVKAPYEPAKHDEFAGAKFDYAIMLEFMKDFLKHYDLYEYEITVDDRAILEKRMLLYAEEAKKYLCNPDNNLPFEFTPPFDNLNINLEDKDPYKISLTKKGMDIILESLLNEKDSYDTNQSIKRIISKVLDDNELTSNDIDFIYLTGGMSKYDKLINTIKHVIPKTVIVAEEPLFCTATGVALTCVIQNSSGTYEITKTEKPKNNRNTFTKQNDIESTENIVSQNDTQEMITVSYPSANTMGMSYFIDIDGDFPVEIISKEQKYPCLLQKSNIHLKTSSQSRMNLILYEGRSVADCGMKLLRKKIIEFAELTEIGSDIDISYKIDADKIITISASVNGEAPIEFSTKEED